MNYRYFPVFCLAALTGAGGCSDRGAVARPPVAAAEPSEKPAPVGPADPEPVAAKPPASRPSPDQKDVRPHYYRRVVALCVGINKYRAGYPPLRLAENDAADFAELVKSLYGYEADVDLLGQKATKANIHAKLDSYDKQLGDQDALLVFFAGHGDVLDLPGRGRAGYLIPYEADLDPNDKTDPGRWSEEAIDMRVFVERLGRMRVQHVVLFADACCSGFMARRGSLEHRVDFQALLSGVSRFVVAATTESGKAKESPDKRNGTFTAALLQRLKALSDFGGTEADSLTDLFLEVRKMVVKESKKEMVPQMSPLGPGDGEFLFLPRNIPQEAMDEVARSAKEKGAQPAQLVRGVIERRQKRSARRTTPADIVAAASAIDYRYSVRAGELSKEWETRLSRFFENASQGDALAMAGASFCHAAGLGTDKNPSEALRWARLAYETDHPAGRHVLAECYRKGLNTPRNSDTADRLLDEAAKAGFPLSLAARAAETLRKNPSREEVQAALQHLEKAREAGVPAAGRILGRVLIGIPPAPGVTPDRAKGMQLLTEAAGKEDVEAQLTLFNLLTGQGASPDDRARAADWLSKAADSGHPLALSHLSRALCLASNDPASLGFKRDLEKARTLALRASEQGEPRADLLLAQMYRKGIGGSADASKARQSLERAAKENLPEALWLQGIWMAYQDVGYIGDTKEAVTPFTGAIVAAGGDWSFVHSPWYLLPLPDAFSDQTMQDLRRTPQDRLSLVLIRGITEIAVKRLKGAGLYDR